MRSRSSSIIGVLLVIWLVIGVVAAAQRGYFGSEDGDGNITCNEASDTGLTILAGPLNYVGVNPQVECDDLPDPDLPEPSE